MNAFLRHLSLLSIVRLLVDMLLPEGALRKICDVILGLVLMLSMLRALEKILHGGFFE